MTDSKPLVKRLTRMSTKKRGRLPREVPQILTTKKRGRGRPPKKVSQIPVVVVDEYEDVAEEIVQLWHICLVCHQAFPKSKQLSAHKEQHGISKFNKSAFVLSLEDLLPNVVLRNESNLRNTKHSRIKEQLDLKPIVMLDHCRYSMENTRPTEKGHVTAMKYITKQHKAKQGTEKGFVKKKRKLYVAKQWKTCKLNTGSSKPFSVRINVRKCAQRLKLKRKEIKLEKRHKLWDVAKDSFCPPLVLENVVPKIEGCTLEDPIIIQEPTVRLDSVFEMLAPIRAEIQELRNLLHVVDLGQQSSVITSLPKESATVEVETTTTNDMSTLDSATPTNSSIQLDEPEEEDCSSMNFENNELALEEDSNSNDSYEEKPKPSVVEPKEDTELPLEPKNPANDKKDGDTFTCGRCSTQFSSYKLYRAHSKTHSLKCGFCKYKFTMKKNYTTHCQTVSTGYKCSYCEETFELKCERQAHVQAHHVEVGTRTKPFEPQNEFECKFCSRKFRFKTAWRRHLRTVHVNEPGALDGLQKVEGAAFLEYLTPEQITQMKEIWADVRSRAAAGETKFPCKFCADVEITNTFVSIQFLNRHIFTIHIKRFKCKFCEKRFYRPRQTLSHENSKHTGEKPFLCTICGHSTASIGMLSTHLKHKHKERQMSCNDCGKKFSDAKTLEHHQICHSTQREYLCTICGRAFARPSSLSAHFKTHAEVRTYSCSDCDKSFKRPDYLKKHEVCHSDLRPFKCDACEKCFKSKHLLKMHSLCHTGRKKK